MGQRTDNPYGATAAHQREIEEYTATVEPLLRAGASMELDGRRPVAELADALQALVVACALGSPAASSTR